MEGSIGSDDNKAVWCLTIMTASGDAVPVQIHHSATVAQLKTMLEEATGVPAARMNLTTGKPTFETCPANALTDWLKLDGPFCQGLADGGVLYLAEGAQPVQLGFRVGQKTADASATRRTKHGRRPGRRRPYR